MQSDRKKEVTRQVISQAKAAIADLSDKEVIDMFLAAGEQISPTTLRRIRAEGSENMGYNYDMTIRPLAKVILGHPGAHIDLENESEDSEKEKADLENVIQAKDIEIDALKKQIATLTSQVEKQDKYLGERREFIFSLEKSKKEIKEQYEAELERQRKINRRYNIAIIIALVLLVLATSTDAIIPWF